MTETETFDGCSRACRKAAAHTQQSGCEFAPEPEPAITLMRPRLMADGEMSLVGERVLLTDLADQIEAALRTVPIRLGPNALAMLQRGETVGLSGGEYADLARVAARALAAPPECGWRLGLCTGCPQCTPPELRLADVPALLAGDHATAPAVEEQPHA